MSLKHTPLYEDCLNIGCRMAPFAGWEMPIQFSGLINEHQSVRQHAGLFDISHMGVFMIEGVNTKDVIQNLVPTDLYRIGKGEACYTLLLNENGGIIDDVILYDLGCDNENQEKFLIVINAGCIKKDITWIKQHIRNHKISISDFKKDGVLLAIQGPKALEKLEELFDRSLQDVPRFGHKNISLKNKYLQESVSIFVARTGYTGEDGFEILMNKKDGKFLWNHLISEGITPCGLGARDTLRLEAGMHLYGNEMNAEISPFEAGLGWLVHLEMSTNFIGRETLEKQTKEGIKKRLISLKIHGKAIGRKGYKLMKNNAAIGAITSGTWSPTLGEAIAMGYVPTELAKIGSQISVEIRGKQHLATIVKRPFYSKKN